MPVETQRSWLVTSNDPLRRHYEPTGWKHHSIRVDPKDSFESVRFVPAACGLYARYGWSIDFLIPEKPGYYCKRCVAALAKEGIINNLDDYLRAEISWPTKAQRRAVYFVADNGPCSRPVKGSNKIRIDVWKRCHSAGWLQQIIQEERNESVATPQGLQVSGWLRGQKGKTKMKETNHE